MNSKYLLLMVLAIAAGIGGALYLKQSETVSAAANAPWKEKYEMCKTILSVGQNDPSTNRSELGAGFISAIAAKCEKGKADCEADENGAECREFMNSITRN